MAATTLGTKPLTVGSLYVWQITITKDGAAWDLSAQTITFFWKRPDGSIFSKSATGNSSGVCTYTDAAPSVLDKVGNTWTFSAYVTNFGYTVPVTFQVVAAP